MKVLITSIVIVFDIIIKYHLEEHLLWISINKYDRRGNTRSSILSTPMNTFSSYSWPWAYSEAFLYSITEYIT